MIRILVLLFGSLLASTCLAQCPRCGQCHPPYDRAPVQRVAGGALRGFANIIGHGRAQAKAEAQARMGLRASHRVPGFPISVAAYEGCGWSPISPERAITISCYWGERQPVDIGVARGADGWYACVGYR